MSFTRTLRAVGGAVVAGALLFGTAPVASADQIRNDQWALNAFGVDDIWKISTGKGITVAVIDDPVDGSHPDLKGNVLPGKSFITGGTADHPYEQREHGTAMASLIAGHGHGPGGADGVKGLAPDAKILPVGMDLTGPDSIPKPGSKGSDYAEALRYAVDHGASVVNMSIYVPNVDITPEEQSAIDYARKHDVLVIASSGNTGGSPTNPSSAPGVLAVGAVDKNLNVWEKSNHGPALKLTAPGVYIRSASVVPAEKGLYHLANGTSDAAAYVSAAAALLRSKFPDLSAGQIANRLIKTAGLPDDMKSAKLPDEHYGYGFIKPYSALTKNVPAGPKDGPFPALSGGTSSDPSSAAGNNATGPKISSQKGLSAPFIILIAVVGVALLAIVVVIVLVAKKKNGRNGPPPGGFGGPGGPGGPGGFVPNPQGPQGPYQQQPGAPGAYPPAPPTQPPGR